MISTLKKKLNKKGFTLAELLIVVAIIAILVAIAIPVFSSQLTAAKQRVDEANLRSAESMATADLLLHLGENEYKTGAFYAVKVTNDGLTVDKAADAAAAKAASTIKSEVDSDYTLVITVDSTGAIVVATTGWTKGSGYDRPYAGATT